MSDPAVPAVAPDRPDNSWKKSDIKAWLDERGIDYDGGAYKDQLLDLVEAT
jgi:hypothetical protein